ncbi:hypothetical protein M501DRAFT_1034668 [Patellaria atrata CBS 101060]|uniref:Protein kinase domain-containing protein n=1 Tax=Patellaria atrata CBS 101060 TaxID=1346257 RepID=A0A9P4S3X5_9PEZI|nr:hypothetical protein M501DRAFT_1034668 [Patellaria atrata CBS 101060]
MIQETPQSLRFGLSRSKQWRTMKQKATNYTTKIDVWSTGCVMAELMLGQPLSHHAPELVFNARGTAGWLQSLPASSPDRSRFTKSNIRAADWWRFTTLRYRCRRLSSNFHTNKSLNSNIRGQNHNETRLRRAHQTLDPDAECS